VTRWCTRLFEISRDGAYGGPPFLSIHVQVPTDYKARVDDLLQKAYAKHNGHLTFSVELPHKPRSTGYKSQNHHLWGHAAQIGQDLGYDRREMVYLIAEMTNGWPMAEYKGKMVPRSEATISSEVAAQAIETAHRIAAENRIILREEA
jgi:hypothetical protein